jgi:hypothetical protein
MSDKWQQINLRLDAELAQALRELKQGHDESVSEVVLRLLRKVVRQSLGASGVPAGRSNLQGRVPRGAVRGGGGRSGKPLASGGRAAPRGAGPGKPWAAPAAGAAEDGTRRPKRGAGKPWAAPAAGAAEDGTRRPKRGAGKPWAAPAAGAAEDGERRPAWGSAAPRGARPIAGKPGRPPRPQRFDDGSEPRRGKFGSGTARPRSPRPSAALGTAKGGLKRPAKAKGRRSTGR